MSFGDGAGADPGIGLVGSDKLRATIQSVLFTKMSKPAVRISAGGKCVGGMVYHAFSKGSPQSAQITFTPLCFGGGSK